MVVGYWAVRGRRLHLLSSAATGSSTSASSAFGKALFGNMERIEGSCEILTASLIPLDARCYPLSPT
jgi:hypothetical protein